MSQWDSNDNFILLPELSLHHRWNPGRYRTNYYAKKESEFEVCPHCATKSKTVHDRRVVKLKDHPIRNSGIVLHVTKRRFRCLNCKRVFTEPLRGVRKGYRTTERFRKGVSWGCQTFADLKRVTRHFRCSTWLVYKIFYAQLESKAKQHRYPWPETIGIDEHSFRRGKHGPEYATLIVDYTNKRIFDLAEGKTAVGLQQQLAWIEGRHRVKNVVLDMCDAFKKFAREHFPQAELVADKFHVLRLLTPALNKRRKEITGDQRNHPVRKLLLRSGHKLKYYERNALARWLEQNPLLKEVYTYKEALHRFYRTRGYDKAARVLIRLTDQMASSQLKEIQTLRKTLMRWRKEILAYFRTGLTNGRTEGYNRLAKLLQYKAFGYKSFKNYRLRLLNA